MKRQRKLNQIDLVVAIDEHGSIQFQYSAMHLLLGCEWFVPIRDKKEDRCDERSWRYNDIEDIILV